MGLELVPPVAVSLPRYEVSSETLGVAPAVVYCTAAEVLFAQPAKT